MKKKILIPIISLFLCSCSFTFPSSTSEKSIENSELSSNTISQNSNNCNTSNNLTNSETNSSFESIYSSNEEKDIAPLYIHFLELGNRFVGDCVYIKAGETDILIDAGSRTTSSYTLTNYINKYCLDKKLEYVIATHCHEDHISGFIGSSSNPGIFETYKCDTIIDFPLTHKEEKSALGNKTQYGRYKELLDKEVSEGAKHFNALQCYNNENEAKRTYEVANGITLTFLYNYYY